MTLRTVLIAAFITIAAAPVAVVALWPLTRPLEREIDQVAEKHLLVAHHVRHALQRYHRDVLSVFNVVADNLAQGDPVNGAPALLVNLHFRHICIIDLSTGVVVGSSMPPGETAPKTIPMSIVRQFAAFVEPGRTVVTGVRKGPDGRPTIYLVKPEPGGRIALGAIGTDYFVSLGRAVAFGRKGHAAIVDQTGTVLSHPRPDWVASLKNIAKVSPVKSMLEGKSGVTKFYSPAAKVDMIAGFTAIPGPGWGVMVPQPFAELEERASAVRVQAQGTVLAGVVIAVILALFLAGRVTRGVSGVVTAASRMRAGDYAARAEAARSWMPSELRNLATAFNDMAGALQRGHEDLDRRVRERTKALTESEQQLREAKEAAEAANAAKSNFLANMSHELRTPLNAILGYSEFISQETLGPIGTPKYREYLDHIHVSGAHLRDVIGDILDASKLSDGAMVLKEEEVPLAEALDAAIVHASPLARKAGVRLVPLFGQDLPAVWADRTRLVQIVDNVLSNAVKFTPEGNCVHIDAGLGPDGAVRVKVRDTGVGIAPEDLDRIAEPFVQADNGLRNLAEGTGLGVTIASALADAHGGSLGYRSALGVGTLVTVTLPADRIARNRAAA